MAPQTLEKAENRLRKWRRGSARREAAGRGPRRRRPGALSGRRRAMLRRRAAPQAEAVARKTLRKPLKRLKTGSGLAQASGK